jgi:enolase
VSQTPDTRIAAVRARQILDSRGRPTVEADVRLEDGRSFGRASVPSGASTGAAEAHELRDGDAAHYGGLSVLKAVSHVNGEIAQALIGRDALAQREADVAMRELDGTPQLARLGANAVLAVSLAIARAAASAKGQQFYERIGELAGGPGRLQTQQSVKPLMPLPMVNILSGGLHAGRAMDVQDFLAIPRRASSIAEAIHAIARVRGAAAEELKARGLPTLLADEGGLSPGCESGRAALSLMVASIERAGLRPGEDVLIAIDVAASSLQRRGSGARAGGPGSPESPEGPEWHYALTREGRTLAGDEMIEMLEGWVREFPFIASIEDGLGEEDWAGWQRLSARLANRVQLVGDDLFTTHPERLARGVREGVANGVLVKANQNGTLTGTLDLIAAARAAGYATIVSARSGETEDAFMSDLAVGSGAGQIKIGSLRTSNTVAKYNQLLRIEESSGAPYAGIAALAGWQR